MEVIEHLTYSIEGEWALVNENGEKHPSKQEILPW